MRRVRYNVAASLDGFITDARGRYDWIPDDPTVDFEAIFERVDTIVLGRRSFDDVLAMGEGAPPWKEGARVFVVSRTLEDAKLPGVTLVRDPVPLVESLRREPGTGEIWLFGGGELFAALLAADQVDSVEVTVVPVLLGAGTPLVAPGIERARLSLTHTHAYPSGMVSLHYDVVRSDRQQSESSSR